MTKLLLLIAILSLALPGLAQTSEMNVTDRQAAMNFLQLVARDSSGQMMDEITEWMQTGKVKIVFTYEVRAMETGEYKDNVAIFVSPAYLATTSLPSLNDDMNRKLLQLVHEFVHVREHLSGTNPVLRKDEVKQMSDKQIAARMWRAELTAVTTEWRLAKAFGATHLMPEICRHLKQGEDIAIHFGLFEMFQNWAKAKGLEKMVPYWYYQILASILF